MKKFKTLTMISAATIVASMSLSAMAATKPATSTSSAVKVKSVQNKKITKDEAKKIALANAKLDSSAVTFEKVELDYENNVAVYDVEFHTNSVEYDYEINASNGVIREKKQESREKRTQYQTNQTVGNQEAANQGTNITEVKAKEIAVAHAGLSGKTVKFDKVELDTDDGLTVYEIEFYHDGMEYNYEINAANGTILEYEIDND